MSDDHRFGLSPRNRNFIVGLIAALLLIFGPINPPGLVVRIAYLIVVPTMVWFALLLLGKWWQIDSLTNDRIERALLAGLAGSFFVYAYQSYTAVYHAECDQYVQTRDGRECVGDYVTVKGGDAGAAFLLILIAGVLVWSAVSRRSD